MSEVFDQANIDAQIKIDFKPGNQWPWIASLYVDGQFVTLATEKSRDEAVARMQDHWEKVRGQYVRATPEPEWVKLS